MTLLLQDALRAVQERHGADAGISLHVGQTGAWSCWSMRDAAPGEPGSEIADCVGTGATLGDALAGLLRGQPAPGKATSYYVVTRFGHIETFVYDGPRAALVVDMQRDRLDVIAVTSEEDTARSLATLARSVTARTTPAPRAEPRDDATPADTVLPTATPLAIYAEESGRRVRIGEVAHEDNGVFIVRLDALPLSSARLTIRGEEAGHGR